MEISAYDWTYPQLLLETAPNGFVHQVMDNISPDGVKYGVNDVAVFPHIMVVHNHYFSADPLVKSQQISNAGLFLDVVVMAGGRNGFFRPPGLGQNITFASRNVMLANFTSTMPHYLDFVGDSELVMFHAALSHEHMRELADMYPERLECAMRQLEHIDTDAILGGFPRNGTPASIGVCGHFDPYSPIQQNCLSAIFGPHVLGNSTGEFITDNFVSYISNLFPRKHQPKSLDKIRYSTVLRRKIHEAREIIDSNIQQPLSLRKLALEVGTNENYLKAGFRHEFGLTVYGYLFECRMRAARQLLLDTSLSVEHIARIVGYTDPVAFYAPFRNRFGITPAQFRTTKFKF